MKLTTLLTASLLAGCSFLEPKVITEPVVVEKDIPIISRPAPLDLKPMKFTVVSVDDIDKVIKLLEEHGSLIILTTRGYEILAVDIAELKRYIKEQKQIIIYYETALTE